MKALLGIFLLYFQFTFTQSLINSDVQDEISRLQKIQLDNIFRNQQACNDSSYVRTNGSCPMTFDGILCWEESPADQWAKIDCPMWVIGFHNSKGKATKFCQSNGEWKPKARQVNNSSPSIPFTNYTDCLNDRDYNVYIIHLPRVRLIGKVGFSLSLVTLIAAIITLLLLKRIHCPRVILHIHLFASFLLFSFLQLFKEMTWVNGIGFEKDVIEIPGRPGKYVKNDDVLHWECRVVTSLYRYAESSNHVMVFCEALYLSMLLSISTFDEARVNIYIISGWIGPLLWTIPYITLMGIYSDGCWINEIENISYLYVFPQLVLVLANFIMFVNIIRELVHKLRNNHQMDSKMLKYKKLAKSTLILLPFFSIYYIVFSWLTFSKNHISVELELVKLYFEIICSSFQGLLISLIFCFFNSEVRAELVRILNRQILIHSAHKSYKKNTNSNSYRKSLTSNNHESLEINQSRRSSALVRFKKIEIAAANMMDNEEVFIDNISPVRYNFAENVNYNTYVSEKNPELKRSQLSIVMQLSKKSSSILRYFHYYVNRENDSVRRSFKAKNSGEHQNLMKRNSSTPNLSNMPKYSTDTSAVPSFSDARMSRKFSE